MGARDPDFEMDKYFAERRERRRDPNWDPRLDDPLNLYPEDDPMDPSVAVSAANPTLPQVPDDMSSPSRPSGAPNLAAALAAAQGEIKNPAKENVADIKSDKGAYKYRYTTLANGLDAIKAPLARHGIATVQCTTREGDLLVLTTRLIHDSGESVECEYPVGNWTKLSHQQMGSALTYARRYSLFSIVGISGADDDDDGKGAGEGGVGAIDDPVIDVDDVAYLEDQIRETGSDLAQFLKYVGAPSIAAMRVSQFKKGMGRLADKKRKMQADGTA